MSRLGRSAARVLLAAWLALSTVLGSREGGSRQDRACAESDGHSNRGVVELLAADADPEAMRGDSSNPERASHNSPAAHCVAGVNSYLYALDDLRPVPEEADPR